MDGKVRLSSDSDPAEFSYEAIEKAYQVINGLHPSIPEMYLFTARLPGQPYGGGGNWMAYLRRVNKRDLVYEDAPLNHNLGFPDGGEADLRIGSHAAGLGWRIREIEVHQLPVELTPELQAHVREMRDRETKKL